jgi:prepilin peptidase CpaA
MALAFLSDAAVVVGVVMLVVAALHDVMARTVPNGVALAIAASGLVAQISQSLMGAGHLLVSIPVALIVFVAAALLWRRGLMGGADVKLFAASALLVPPMLVPSLLASITIGGGLLALVYLVARRRMPRPEPGRPPGLFARVIRLERWRLRRGGPLPYAVAIAGGVVFVVSRGGILS